MRKMELIAPCHFGLEAVLKKEIYDLAPAGILSFQSSMYAIG